MAENDSTRRGGEAWFLGEGAEEGDSLFPGTPAGTPEPQMTVPLPPEVSQDAPEPPAAVPVEPEPAPDAVADVEVEAVVAEAAAAEDDAPAPVVEDVAATIVPEQAAAPQGVGFTAAEILRLGGAALAAPTAAVAMLVTVKTRQRVRRGQVVMLREARCVLGRGRVGCFIDDAEAAEFHAVITCRKAAAETAYVLHTAPGAPVSVNGSAVSGERTLADRERITIGSTELMFVKVPLEPEETA